MNSYKINKLVVENPFLWAVSVFCLSVIINHFLDLGIFKNLFNWVGYYFNLTLYWLNIIIQTPIKGHPYIQIPVIQNPLTPDFMKAINPWIWLRGVLLGAAMMGGFLVYLLKKNLKIKDILIFSVFTGVLQFCFYAMPLLNGKFSISALDPLLEKTFPSILVSMVVAYFAFLFTGEYTAYLIGFFDKKSRYKKTETIFVKYACKDK